MGYNEVQGLTGGGGFEFINFKGKGQMLSINYSKGLQNQIQNQSITSNSSTYNDYESFSFSFREPRLLDTPNSIGFSIFTTSAPKSASCNDVMFPATTRDKSRTLMPFNGPTFFVLKLLYFQFDFFVELFIQSKSDRKTDIKKDVHPTFGENHPSTISRSSLIVTKTNTDLLLRTNFQIPF